MKLTARNLHRDLAYFYIGLIIAFSISGILLNHRQTWYPKEYKYNATPVEVSLPRDPKNINDVYITALSNQLNIEDQVKDYRVRGEKLRVVYNNHWVEIDMKTGKGEKESYFQVPLVSQFTTLHKDTNNSWIWYSDIFGIAMLVIAITGMFIQKGRTSFLQRGWKFALVGITFPLIFLFLLS